MSNREQLVVAPQEFSFIDQPEMTISFFRQAEGAYLRGRSVIYDLSKVESLSVTTAAILVSHIKDRNVNFGMVSKLISPEDPTVAKQLRQFGIFKRVVDHVEEIHADVAVHRLTNIKVANLMAREIVLASTFHVYGENRRISELYSTLIELMANTNNHADSEFIARYPWWLFVFPDQSKSAVKFVFLDLGVGLFESIPVRQWLTRNPFPPLSKRGDIALYERGGQLAKIFRNLEAGDIKSSTKLSSRGKGLPYVIKCAKSGHFKEFYIVSNDAYIDVLSNRVSAMNENFSGTLFYFEFQAA